MSASDTVLLAFFCVLFVWFLISQLHDRLDKLHESIKELQRERKG
jgi:hypothetical protein